MIHELIFMEQNMGTVFFLGGGTLKNKFYLNNFKLIKCYKNKQIKEYVYIFTQIPLGNSFY